MRLITSLLTFILIAMGINPVVAQEEFVSPPSRYLATVPFTQLTGGIVLVQARLNNSSDTLNFVLDTGSSGISLDSTTVKMLGLTAVPTDRTILGIAGIHKVSFVYNQSLRFPGITVDSLNFHINDYSILTAVYGEKIDGIIGYSLISRYILKLDYDSLKLSFYTKGTMRYPRGGYLMRPAVNQLVTQWMKVRDEGTVNGNFLYDMGAGVNMIFPREFVDDSVFLDKRRKRFIKEGEGLGGKLDMELTTIKEVKLGPYRFRSVPIYIFDDVNNVTRYPYRCGLIGNDILRRFNVTLNYDKSEIFLQPNTRFAEPFDYSYSGLELYLVDGMILVGDVAKGSPAEAAGVREDDEVIAVNNNFSLNLNAYKIALQVPNERVKIIIRREGVLKEIEFKVKSIH